MDVGVVQPEDWRKQARKERKLPNGEVVQIKRKVGFDRKKEKNLAFSDETLKTIGEIWWNGEGNLIGRANESSLRRWKSLKRKVGLMEEW